MFDFKPTETSCFRYYAEFSRVPYANVSFYDAAGEHILFHLSLRQDECLAVCNHRTGQDWGRERRRRVDLSDSVLVEVYFDAPHLRVDIGGTTAFHFGKLFRPTPYRGFDRIASVDFQGGVRPAMHDAAFRPMPLPASGAPVLTPQLQLQARLPQNSLAGTLELWGNTGVRLPAIIYTDEEGAPVAQAVLPGWIWNDVDNKTDLSLHFVVTESGQAREMPAISLTREVLARQIVRTLEQIDPGHASFAAMQVIEHARFGELVPLLPQAARKTLIRAARFYGLDSFLFPPGDRAAETAKGGHPEDLSEVQDDLVMELLARFHQTLLRAPDTDPVALAGELLPADGQTRLDFFVSLSEIFCRGENDFAAFAALDESGVTGSLQPCGEPWFDSSILPFLLLQHRLDEVRDILWSLKEPQSGWVVTPALALIARHLSHDRGIDEKHREEMLYAFIGYLDRRAEEYFNNVHCQELLRACVILIGGRHGFADYLGDNICALALRVYGLSRDFWELMEASGDVPRHMLLFQSAFETVSAFSKVPAKFRAPGDHPPQALLDALTLFEEKGAIDVPRLRRELLGPTGPARTREAALRALAHPKSPEATPYLSGLASAAVRDAYADVSRAPYSRLQRDASRRIRALGHLRSPAEITSRTETLMNDLILLAGERSRFVGLTMMLALLMELSARRPDGSGEQAADLLLARLGALLHWMSDDTRRQMATAPALRTILRPLQRAGHPQTEAALIMLSEHMILPDPGQEEGDTILPAPSALFDTLVVVFSCLPNLDTRIPAMRAGWLSDLTALGVPYVIVVGNGDGRREGDVVHLDAPDNYEGLPLKTLAAVRWVHDHTQFAHMLKIDDDCFLNAEAFFDSLSYRKFDYYGRRLTRKQGQMDRAWHNAKSQSQRGRCELDKSPEPSTYADGGSGWTISRRAMSEALQAIETPEGQLLIQTSFMEDKLLGDLLARRGIQVEDEDYCITIRRRAHGKAIPVARWVNSFDASTIADIKLVHLDEHASQAQAETRLNQPVLRPAKIWPSYQDARLVYQSNALEMVSPADRLERAIHADVAVVACLRNEMFILPHFLDHYRNLGAGAFLIADNFSDDGTLEYLASQEDVALFSVDTDYNLSSYGVAWQQALLSEFRLNKWSVIADADEFLVWQKDHGETLSDLLAGDAFAGADAARIFMLDMYPKGPLSKADFRTGTPFEQAGWCDREPFLTNWPGRGPYSNMPVWTSALRHRLIPGSRPDLFVAQKIALLRYQPWMRLSAGLHFLTDIRLARRELLFAHFKYNADFRRKVEAEVARQQHFNDAEEYRKYLALVSEGRDVIHESGLSVPWYESPFVMNVLAPTPGS